MTFLRNVYDAKGVTTVCSYSLRGELVKQAYSTGKNELFEYDSNGNQTKAMNTATTIYPAKKLFPLLCHILNRTEFGAGAFLGKDEGYAEKISAGFQGSGGSSVSGA